MSNLRRTLMRGAMIQILKECNREFGNCCCPLCRDDKTRGKRYNWDTNKTKRVIPNASGKS